MSSVLRVLIVEDDAGAVEDWRRAVERHNSEEDHHEFRIEATYAATQPAAEALAASQRFDIAVVDLRLAGEVGPGGHNQDGNAVVKWLTETTAAAVAIHTGQPSEAEDFASSSSRIRVFAKGDGLEPVIAWLREQSGIALHMQNTIRAIEADIATLFHQSIWPRWRLWSDTADPKELEPALARHVISHVHAGLLDASSGKVHAEEWYFVPVASQKALSTGDLVCRDGKEVEIIITPRCDMAHEGKSGTVQLAKCQDISALWKETAEKGDKALGQLRQHQGRAVQHFLPPMSISDREQKGPWFVRFDQIESLSLTKDLRELLVKARFASLTSEYLPSLVQRLGAYFSRIGSPDVS